MARIFAFRGYRPPKALADKVASPPYDVLNSDEARKLASGNQKSFLHVNKPEIDLDPEIDLHDDSVYAKAKENLDAFIENGWLVADDKPCLYAYSQRMGEHTQLGLMAAASVDDYDQDKIKKHEKTRKDKEDDRARHVDETNANAGPVFLTYRRRSEVDSLMKQAISGEPEVSFIAEDGIEHKLWVIDDDALQDKLIGAFGNIDFAYVADGHHRAKSGSRVRASRQAANPSHTGNESYNRFLAVYFPDNQLKILDYNRVVKDLAGMSDENFIEKLSSSFDISDSDTPSPQRTRCFGMYLKGRWYRLIAKEGSFPEGDPVLSLDVSILQNNLLHPILGIEDPRSDARIDFVGGIRGSAELEKRVNSGEWAVAFAMHPTTMDQLMAISDAGATMPPKSTWFEPKLRSGLVVHLLS